MAKESRSALQRIKRYITQDMREIINPSSLPDPPGYIPPPPRTLRKQWETLSGAVRGYINSWDPKSVEAGMRQWRGEPEPTKDEEKQEPEELKQLAEEFGQAARGGAKAMVPYLQHLYNTRAAAYRDAVKQFISGYKEGFQEAHETEAIEEMIGGAEEIHINPPPSKLPEKQSQAEDKLDITPLPETIETSEPPKKPP